MRTTSGRRIAGIWRHIFFLISLDFSLSLNSHRPAGTQVSSVEIAARFKIKMLICENVDLRNVMDDDILASTTRTIQALLFSLCLHEVFWCTEETRQST